MKDKEIVLEINGREYKVTVNNFSAQEARVTVDGKSYQVGLKDLGSEIADIKPVAAPRPAQPVRARKDPAQPALHRPKSLGDANVITAPLPGQIIKFLVKEGDTVEAGQKVCVIEAMKMESDINAAAAGVVIDIKHREGDSVNQGEVLIMLKPAEN